MEEEWKDIDEHIGLYQVSSMGRVRNARNNHVLKQQVSHKGYLRIILQNKKAVKFSSVHRLVAIAFIPNTENRPEVNHKDLIKTNNSVSNLEWATRKENVRHYFKDHPPKNKLHKHTAKGKGTCRRMLQLSLIGVIIKSHESITLAHADSGVCISSICLCAKGINKTGGGFIWKYNDSCIE